MPMGQVLPPRLPKKVRFQCQTQCQTQCPSVSVRTTSIQITQHHSLKDTPSLISYRSGHGPVGNSKGILVWPVHSSHVSVTPELTCELLWLSNARHVSNHPRLLHSLSLVALGWFLVGYKVMASNYWLASPCCNWLVYIYRLGLPQLQWIVGSRAKSLLLFIHGE